MISTLWAFFRGWKGYAALGLMVGALGVVILWQRVALANRATEIVKLQGELVVTRNALDRAVEINRENTVSMRSIRADDRAAIAAITADRDRLAGLLKTTRIIREKITVEASACVGVPPALRSVAGWLRDNAEDR